jgi:hypothetical protein
MSSLLLNAVEIDLVRQLLAQQTRFLVLGGHAVQYYGHLRPAKDLDLFIDPAGENPQRVVSALAALQISHPDLTAERLSKSNQQIRVGGWYNTELLTAVSGLPFELAYAAKTLSNEQGLSIPVMSREHLISSKRALGRTQDLEDVAALEKLATTV